MKVMWGLYSSQQIITSEIGGRADDEVSILYPIIALFAILCLCFLQKELDKWFVAKFNINIHLNVHIKREVLRFRLQEEKRQIQEND